jgi:carbonic anhydrase
LNHIDDIVASCRGKKEEQAEEKKMPKEKNLLGSINANIEHSNRLIQENSITKSTKLKLFPCAMTCIQAK